MKSLIDLEKKINSELTTKINKTKIKHNQIYLEIDKEDLIDVLLFVKTNKDAKFRQLIDITVVDYPEELQRFKIVYLLLSHEFNQRMILSYFINEKFDKVQDKHRKPWVVAQWCTTGFLWYTWLSHDIANIAVFLPRELPVNLLIAIIVLLSVLLFYIFWDRGGRIQRVVYSKTGTRYTRSATIIDFVYAVILLYFKQYNDIPMSTTWVFVGLLCGRELAISTMNKDYKLRYVFPLIGKDFLKMIFGLTVSVGIVLSIHYLLIPNGF